MQVAIGTMPITLGRADEKSSLEIEGKTNARPTSTEWKNKLSSGPRLLQLSSSAHSRSKVPLLRPPPSFTRARRRGGGGLARGGGEAAGCDDDGDGGARALTSSPIRSVPSRGPHGGPDHTASHRGFDTRRAGSLLRHAKRTVIPRLLLRNFGAVRVGLLLLLRQQQRRRPRASGEGGRARLVVVVVV